ncbi:MAG TPA: PQQ-binding-like beta-propeller repeat protein [Acidimicrobiales bacterium]|nr:PQQ-binding-like beta-propeller repeat protein [Acidimicrobiales bacterium]
MGLLTLGLTSAFGALAGVPAGAARADAVGAVGAASIDFGSPIWTVGPLADAPNQIVFSSPNVAQLGGGPAVVVGDQAGTVYSYDLATGAPVWTYQAGAPVNSSPSVAAVTAGSPLDSVYVGSGDAANPTVGGYQAISPSGGDQWFTQETNPSSDPTAHNGVQASLAVGSLQGSTDVTAGSLGQEQDALNASNGSVLGGFPWFQADSNFTTPALADLYSSGQTEIVEGGDSSAGLAFGQTYQNGGHLRILSPTGNAGQAEPNGGLVCQFNSNETVQSSPAVGEFFGSSPQVGIAFGTGATYHSSDTDKVIAVDSHCNLAWSATLDGSTTSSPALADVLGNGQLQVVEGTNTGSTGSVYALNGANGGTLWKTTVGQVIGSVVTADLGTGSQDVLAPTTNGVVVLDGKTGSIVTTLASGTGFQNSPLVTEDPNGTIGITLAGYQSSGSFIYHYEIARSNGSVVNEPGAWPQFHHDPQLTGDAGTAQNIQVPCNAPAGSPNGYYESASDGGIFTFGNMPFCGSTGSITLNKPVVGMAVTHDAGGYWEVATDGGIFAFGDAKFFGSTGSIHLNAPIVGMAATPDGGGYWLVASDGGIFAFGDAKFDGATGNIHLNKPIVGMAATPDGGGYWLVASDGGIFSFGDAKFHGSTGNIVLNKPIVGMAATTDGGGYWLVASDGGVFSFGDATFHGSTGAIHLDQPVVGMEATPTGNGYRFVAADGGIFDFGDAAYLGSEGGQHLNKPIVGMAGF